MDCYGYEILSVFVAPTCDYMIAQLFFGGHNYVFSELLQERVWATLIELLL